MRCTPILLLLCILVGFSLATDVAADNKKEVRTSDVNAMIKKGKTPREILVVMNERGVKINMTRNTERQFKKWGFTNDDIDMVKQMLQGRKFDLRPKESEDEGDKPEFPVGFALEEKVAERVEQAITATIRKADRDDYVLTPFERFSLYAKPERTEELTDKLKAFERKLIGSLPKYFANATSPNTAVLCVVENTADRQKLIKFVESGPVISPARYWSARAYFRSTMAIVEAADTADDTMSDLSFGLGYITISQLSMGRVPMTISWGFGSTYENLATQQLTSRLGPDSNSDPRGIGNWQDFAKRQANGNRMPSVSELIGYEYEDMRNQQCVEAWSFVHCLMKKPEPFSKALDTGRDGRSAFLGNLLKAYEINQGSLQSTWSASNKQNN